MRAAWVVIASAIAAASVRARADDARELAPLHAGPAADGAHDAGQALLDQATAYGKAGKFELALAVVRDAAVRFPSAEHDCWAALTYLRLDRLTAAQVHLDLAATRGDAGPTWCDKVATDVRDALTRREYSAIAIVVDPPDAVVTVGEVVMRGGRTLWLPPGTATVSAIAAGRDPASARVEVAPSAATPVEVTLKLPVHAAVASVASAASAVPPSDEAREPASHRRLGWIVIGGGAAAIAVGATFHVLASERRSRADQLFTDDPAFADESSRFSRDRAIAITGYGVGAAALAAGAYLLARGHGREHAVDVSLSSHGAIVSASWGLW